MTRQVCKQIINLSLFFAVCFLPCVPLSAQWAQLGEDIDGEADNDESGRSVAISSDGTTVAIGAPINGSIRTGHVRVYKRVNGTWTQLGAEINGEAILNQSGTSVALSSDGTIVAIGAPLNAGGGSTRGHVRVYQLVNNTWTQLGADIDGKANIDRSGMSVSLSSDGMTVAFGAIFNAGGGSGRGQVRVYQFVNNTWTQQGADINGEADFDNSGGAVSLSSDGTIVAIGVELNAGGGGSYRGHVRVYQLVSGTWTQLGSDIDGKANDDRSGASVSLSSNGTIVAIGAPASGSQKGYVRVFQLGSGAWTQLGADINGEGNGDQSGYSVSLSSDGTTVAIGAPANAGGGSYRGHVRVYQFGSGTWTQRGADIDGEANDDSSGKSVSLSSDGETVAIGANFNDGTAFNTGHVRVYKYLPCITPTAYAVTGGGSYCFGGAGVAVGLSNSESGVTYQLKNGVTNVGTPVNGTTGSAISFGNQTATGTYTVAATRTTDGCLGTMSGSATITTNPLSTAQTLTGGGPYCAGGTGVIVGLSNSESGVTYQLKKDNSNDGSPVNGTGSAISFGSKTAVGTYTVVATRTNDGCTATMNSNTVISIDETLPAFVTATVPANITLNCTDVIPAAVHPTATNSCSTVSFTGESSTKGTAISQCSFYSYTITRTWTATDKRGNTATVSQVLTVQDNTAPVIAPLANITVTEGTIPTSVASSDNCSTTPVITFTETKVNNTPPACKNYSYVLTRTWIATDVCGNSGTRTQLIKAEGIRITCPSDKTINTNADGVNNYNCSTLVSAAMGVAPAFTDGCDVSVLRYTMTGATTGTGNGSVAGLAFNEGITKVTYALQSALTDVCSFNVTTKDVETPRFGTIANAILDVCDLPNPITMTTPSTSDNCSGVISVTPSIDVTATVSSCSSKVETLKYTKSVTRTWTATDLSGNTSTKTQTMYLRDMLPPTAICKDITVNIGVANVSVLATQINNNSNDNCTAAAALSYAICRNISGVCSFSSSISLTASLIPTGVNFVNLPVTLRVTDVCGNANTCNATIRLQKLGTLINGKTITDLSTQSDSPAEIGTSIPAIPSNIDATHGSLKCFPNPFSDNLNLEYNLTHEVSKVTLKVYDNQGRLMTKSEQGEQLAGYYQVNWNLSDLSSGMYHICLEIDGKCMKMERVIMIR